MSYAYAIGNLSVSTGWQKLTMSSTFLSNISGMQYYANGDFSLPPGTYIILAYLTNSSSAWAAGGQSSSTPVIPTSMTKPGLDFYQYTLSSTINISLVLPWQYTFSSNNAFRMYFYSSSAVTISKANITFLKII